MVKKICVILCLLAGIVSAQISHVVPPGTPGVAPATPFNSWGTAATSIQDAVNAAAGQGWTNVLVSNGTYVLTGHVNVAAAMYVRSWHDGVLDRAGTIVDGGYASGNPTSNRCFYVNHANAVLAGFTITNGYANYGAGADPNQAGGGVYVNAGLLRDCTVAGCGAQYLGGGVMVKSGGMVRDCTMIHNTTPLSGGGATVSGGVLDNCEVISNYSGSSGGGVSLSLVGLVTNTRVKYNSSASVGGGVTFAATGGLITHSDIFANFNNGSGAGIYLDGMLATAAHCMVNCNTSYYTSGSSTVGGGGVFIYNGAVATHCRIISNSAAIAGGVFLRNWGACTYSDIIGNVGHGVGINRGGGGLYVLYTGLVQNCRIMHNISTNGAGVTLWTGADVKLRNCLIAGNVATGTYGVVYVYQGTGNVLQNCTIVSNYAQTYGGGLYLSAPGTTVVENSIVYFNANGAGGAFSNYYRGSAAVVFNNSCAAPSVDAFGAQNTSEDPRCLSFAPGMDAGLWNFRLQPQSPCVNAGLIQPDWMYDAVDLDGRARLDRFARLVDMGCYEYISRGSVFLVQ